MPILIDGCTYLFDGYSENLAASHAAAVITTVPDDPNDVFDTAILKIFRALKTAASHPRLRVVRAVSDISEARGLGQTGIILGFQNTLPLATDLDRVWLFAQIGVRVVQLTYNARNFVGDGCLENPDGGLSRFGRNLIKELNSAGIVVDLSHAGPRTALEAVEHSDKPPIVSHAGIAAVVRNPRNVNDEVIDAVAARGGVIGCCPWASMCWLGGEEFTVRDFIRHVDYVANRVGAGHVGISTDSACTVDVARTQSLADAMPARYPEILTSSFVAKFGNRVENRYPKGLQSMRDLPSLLGVLIGHGYSEDDASRILGGNFFRVFEAVWGG
jgi:membrane dipeptidase